MRPEQVRQTIIVQFEQSLVKSNVPIRSIPSTELRAVINALADGVLAALAAVAEEIDTANGSRRFRASLPVDPLATEEQVLWRGRPYLTIGTIYELTTQRIRVFSGILGNLIEEIELVRVKDTAIQQHLGERILDVGDVTIISTDASTPEVTFHNVRSPLEVRELIRKAANAEKQRQGLRYSEDVD